MYSDCCVVAYDLDVEGTAFCSDIESTASLITSRCLDTEIQKNFTVRAMTFDQVSPSLE